ncbi:MAG: asparagine synthase-related protein, partial [Nanoarchaeota archaeon]
MCGIIGIFNELKANENLKLALTLLEKRGKDGFGVASEKEVRINKDLNKLIIPTTKNILGHTLHSVVDFVPQPLKRKGILAANCEIYNWKELAEKYNISAKNDAELLLHLLDRFGVKEEKLNELDGVYAFAYWKNKKVYLVRDLLGVKPLWFALEKGKFAFASEKKVLVKLGFKEVEELNPRQVLEYTINTKKTKTILRPFFRYTPELTESKVIIMENLRKLLSEAIEKRVPEKKFGVLFSGGIDSVFLAHTLKKMGANFTCYTTAMEEKEGAIPSDLIAAEKVAKELGFKLKVRKVKLEEIQEYLSKVVPLIEDSNVVKAAVAMTLYFACEMAKKDGCKVIFSGLGSEEIFAGYERHKRSTNLNAECLAGLRKLYERDLYRDDVVSMANELELRLPFLDKSLVEYALRVPDKYKLSEAEGGKLIFRELALEQGIPQEWAFRKKVAAQYGSRIDWAMDKTAKQQGLNSKSAYLQQFYAPPNSKLGVLFSSGKDSTYAAQVMQRQNYELSCLITVKSK